MRSMWNILESDPQPLRCYRGSINRVFLGLNPLRRLCCSHLELHMSSPWSSPPICICSLPILKSIIWSMVKPHSPSKEKECYGPCCSKTLLVRKMEAVARVIDANGDGQVTLDACRLNRLCEIMYHIVTCLRWTSSARRECVGWSRLLCWSARMNLSLAVCSFKAQHFGSFLQRSSQSKQTDGSRGVLVVKEQVA